MAVGILLLMGMLLPLVHWQEGDKAGKLVGELLMKYCCYALKAGNYNCHWMPKGSFEVQNSQRTFSKYPLQMHYLVGIIIPSMTRAQNLRDSSSKLPFCQL